MERNPNDMGNSSAEDGATGGAAGPTGGYGSGGYGSGSTGASPAGLSGGSAPLNTGVAGTAPLADGFATTSQGSGAQGALGEEAGQGRGGNIKDAAQQRASQAREALGTAGTKARDFKHTVEQTLADKLESGANRLRSRGGESTAGASGTPGSPAYAGAGGTGTMGATATQSSGQSERVAGGMEATARWLREGDIKSSVEEQARTNPGRTLLIALGVGYLLGKSLRR